MRWLKGLILAIILLAVLLVGILFAVNNREALPLNLIWIELPPASLSVWLLASLAVGVLLGMLAMSGDLPAPARPADPRPAPQPAAAQGARQAARPGAQGTPLICPMPCC